MQHAIRASRHLRSWCVAFGLAVASCAPDIGVAPDDDGGRGGGGAATADAGGAGAAGAAGGSAGTVGSGGSSGGEAGAISGAGGSGIAGGGSGGSAIAGAGGSGGGGGDGGTAAAAGRGGTATGDGGSGGMGGGGRGGSGGGGGRGGAGGSAGTGTGGASVPACATNQVASCTTSGGQVACHFGGNPGNYEVTVELGGATASDGYVEAESYRRMLGSAATTAGATRLFSFITNVRVYEGEPVRPDQDSTYPKGTPGLDIYVRGPAPRLVSICHRPATAPVMIWIAGDSTVCDQAGSDYAGWGQHLPQHFLPPISVANYADSGESSGSFLNSGKLWAAIKNGMKAGDHVFIQFGHNDKDVTAATFRANLTTMLTDVQNAGATPVLFTPISRVGYALADEHVNSTGANLPQIIRDLGTAQNVPVIDLTVTTWNWLQTIRWQDNFALGTDRTHTNPAGAGVIAGFVRDGVRAKIPSLVPHLR